MMLREHVWDVCMLGVDEPSSFLSTLSMAPEQPPQLMVTLNSYVCVSDIVSVVCGLWLQVFAGGANGRQIGTRHVGDWLQEIVVCCNL